MEAALTPLLPPHPHPRPGLSLRPTRPTPGLGQEPLPRAAAEPGPLQPPPAPAPTDHTLRPSRPNAVPCLRLAETWPPRHPSHPASPPGSLLSRSVPDLLTEASSRPTPRAQRARPKPGPSWGFLNLPSVYFLPHPAPRDSDAPPPALGAPRKAGPPLRLPVRELRSRVVRAGPCEAAGPGHACGGRGRRLSAPGGCSPRSRAAQPAPWPPNPGCSATPRRQDPQAPGHGRRQAATGTGEFGAPALRLAGIRAGVRGAAGPLTSRHRCGRGGGGGTARGARGALPAGARAEAGEARQHPPPPARRAVPAESPRRGRLRGHARSRPPEAGGAPPFLLLSLRRRPLGERVRELGGG